MNIYIADSKDRDFIVQSQLQMAQESENLKLDENTVKNGVEHIIKNSNIGFYLIAEVQEQPAACLLVLKEWSDWRCGNVLWIHSVFVITEKRRLGIYSKMYKHLQSRVESDESLRGLRLYVDKSNEPAIKTYENLGMSRDHYHMYEWMKTF